MLCSIRMLHVSGCLQSTLSAHKINSNMYDCTHNTAGLVDKFQANLIVIYFLKILTFPVPCLGVAYML